MMQSIEKRIRDLEKIVEDAEAASWAAEIPVVFTDAGRERLVDNLREVVGMLERSTPVDDADGLCRALGAAEAYLGRLRDAGHALLDSTLEEKLAGAIDSALMSLERRETG